MYKIGAVVVVFNPNMEKLISLVQRLVGLVDDVVVINNGFPLSDILGFPSSIWVLHSGQNIGVAAALNLGVRYLQQKHCSHAWSFDQDSLPGLCTLDELLLAWQAAPYAETVAAVAPGIQQHQTALPLPFLVEDAHGKLQVKTLHRTEEIVAAITSGMLFRIDVWCTLGGALEPLFIDHVDTEWCYRLRSAGWRILAVPSASIDHQLGEPGPRLAWLGPHMIVRPPSRTYFMLRNGWLLGRMSNVHSGWQRYQRRQAFKIIVVALMHGPQRWGQLKAILRAVFDARRNHSWIR